MQQNFIDEKLAIKVIIDLRPTLAHKFDLIFNILQNDLYFPARNRNS